jgi:peptidoglycan/LPS O-acetylase OafA/YrhL
VLAMFKGGLLTHSIARMDWPAALFVIASNGAIFLQDLFLFFAITPDGASLYPTAHFITEPGMQLNALLLVPQAWSLGIELTFYLIAPFICRSPRRLAALFAFGALARIALGFFSPTLDPWTYRFSPAEMMLFASGGLGYFVFSFLDRPAPARALRIAGALCLAMLAIIITLAPPSLQSFSPALFLLNGKILVLIAISCPVLFVATRGLKWDGMIGELSYPMYLSHLFVYETMATYAPSSLRLGNLTYVCATIAFSLALLWLVVLPVDRFRRNLVAAPRRPGDQNTGLVPTTTAAHATFEKSPAE